MSVVWLCRLATTFLGGFLLASSGAWTANIDNIGTIVDIHSIVHLQHDREQSIEDSLAFCDAVSKARAFQEPLQQRSLTDHTPFRLDELLHQHRGVIDAPIKLVLVVLGLRFSDSCFLRFPLLLEQ